LDEEWVYTDPSSPSEGAQWASEDQFGGRSEPTPKWESGTSTYKVEVFPTGDYTIVVNGILAIRFNPDGKVISFKLMPNWTTSWCGRDSNLRGAMIGVCIIAQSWVPSSDLIEIFEGDSQFWKTGLVAGTRWCKYERGGRLGYGGFVVDLHA
jgi:hypothetical protein